MYLQVPEYCSSLEESEVCQNAYELIFAFDEIVALGYRENVNLAQIRTFIEMDSHEEKMFKAVRQVTYTYHTMYSTCFYNSTCLVGHGKIDEAILYV